ncbi:MAG: HAMP domain-containing sensor histidine kinase [Pseudomonadota bacterium]
MSEQVPVLASLRLRLLIGAGAIALVALFAAALAAFGVSEASRMIERSATAQQRIDLLSSLSGRVSDYAVVAVETAAPDVPSDARLARLTSAAVRVEDAFGQVDQSLERAVAEVEKDGETEQMRRATQSLGIARMRAQFAALRRNVEASDASQSLRAYLDGFATQFSPLLNAAVNEERRNRDWARQAVADLRNRMVWQAGAAAGVAALLVGTFYMLLVRPLLQQLGEVRTAAASIGAGEFDIRLPETGRSELGLLIGEVNRTAEQLKDRQGAVDADRAQLNEIIAERTEKLEDANAQLSRIDTDRRRFFADIGHELRTPLTVILAESELGLGEEVAGDAAAESLSIIHARARRLNRRIDDLLRVARSETGQIELQTGRFDMAEAVNAAVSDMEPLARRRDVRLVRKVTPASVEGDPDWCRQVISGLIENALKKSPPGAVIEISCSDAGGGTMVTVLDEGTGIPDGELEGVFGRFTRGTRDASGSGFGVGLALARWVIERQGGSIVLQSPIPRPPEGGHSGGRGVMVTVSLPEPTMTGAG